MKTTKKAPKVGDSAVERSMSGVPPQHVNMHSWNPQGGAVNRIAPHLTTSDYFKSLSPPPDGQYWERHTDGTGKAEWVLLRFERQEISSSLRMVASEQVVVDEPTVIEHVLMPADTLAGITLKYNVSATELRQANNFSGNKINFGRTTLKIPLRRRGQVVDVQSPSDPGVVLEKFRSITLEGDIEARYYLEEGRGLEGAYELWKQDQEWEQAHSGSAWGSKATSPDGASGSFRDEFVSSSRVGLRAALAGQQETVFEMVAPAAVQVAVPAGAEDGLYLPTAAAARARR